MPEVSSTEILRAICDISPVAIVGINELTLVDLWSASAADLFGIPPLQALGRPFPFQHILARGMHSAHLEHTWILKNDGSPVEVECRVSPRQPAGLLIVMTDLTHAAATGRLVKAFSRFRELLEAAPDAIVEVDSAGKVVLMNVAAEKLFGYTREELLGQSVDILLPDGMRQRHSAHRDSYRLKPSTRPMGAGLPLLAVTKAGNQFPVEISLSPVKSDEGFRTTAIIRDVSERKFAEEKLRVASLQLEARNREVERANRLKSEFLASMSHELRTPLHTIIGFTELLGEGLEGPLNEKQRRYVDYVHRDSLHLLELINDILDISKIESGRMELHLESLDAGQILDDTLSSILPSAAAQGIEVHNFVGFNISVVADRVRLREIFSNLLSNAIKFTPNGGTVEIHRGSTLGNFISFSISDTGIGIDAEYHEAIFEKFRQISSTTRGVREGTGLGLAIVKHLVTLHGGSISLESKPGEGSCFTFTLPTSQAAIFGEGENHTRR